MDYARELKNLWNMKVTVIPVLIVALDTVTKGSVQGLEDLESKRISGDYLDDSIIKIDQNSEKSSEDLKRLTVTLTSLKDL